jgi:type I restriction enzyme M protein
VANKLKATDLLEEKSLETWLWDAACGIRGGKDALKYKDYM